MSVAIILDFVKYQIEWLRSHNDLEFEPVIEDAIVKMLKDTGKSFIDEQNAETSQFGHIADIGKKVSISCGHENDPISRQAAIDALDIAIECYDEIAEKYRKKADIERNDYMDMRDNAYEAQQLAQWLNELKYLREKIEQITIKTETKWIPVSERVPEKNCRCLTTNEAWGSFEVDWNAWIDGRWLYPNEKPIAWMPLPEPYRGGEQDDR